MMIKLTQINIATKAIQAEWFNPAHIVWIGSKDGLTLVKCVGDVSSYVRETPEEIAAAIGWEKLANGVMGGEIAR